jgi:molybdopterin/thiamine biosynthesis adenylyltransferase/rhodanese-related sulfurtransferase
MSDRYQRQMLLPGWGPSTQRLLTQASVLVVGAGGLGCPALQYLAAAGLGHIGLVDGDRVSLTDLHRQILFTEADIGAAKTSAAAAALSRLNPEVQIRTYPFRLTAGRALELLSGYDVVLDASDNFGTRYMLNDACALLGKPLVYGSVSRFEGQVAVFNGDCSYRDLFPEPPPPGEVPSCEEAGVLGVVAGIIGNLQALEVIKLVTGLGEPLAGRLLTYQALTQRFYEVALTPRNARRPRTAAEFADWDYPDGCAYTTVDNAAFNALRFRSAVLVLDVREPGELPVAPFPHERWPLSRLRAAPGVYRDRTIVVFCQSGIRSREAAGLLAAGNTVFQLKDGLAGWLPTP